LYDCECDECADKKVQINLTATKDFKPLLKVVKKAFKQLHTKGSYNPKELFKTAEYKELIQETRSALSDSLKDNVLSNDMLNRFENDIFLFSGLKTHAQLFEASRLLLTEDKKIKPFATFSRDIDQMSKDYNEQYLQAEYQYAVGAVQMAERWENFSEDDRFLLQYRTAKDDRVRKSHQDLDQTTLPKSNEFWDLYTPPNGWRCRCTVVQVLERKNKSTNPATAKAAGEVATTQISKSGQNSLEIFRFNPAKKKVIFPPKHPYNKIGGSTEVKKQVKQQIQQVEEKQQNPEFGINAELKNYEKQLGVKANRKFFSEYLKKPVDFTSKTRKRGQGAHYSPATKTVVIPINKRRKDSKWGSESIIYHEFGHASDWQNGMRSSKIVTDLMTKYRKEYRKEGYKKFKELDQAWRKKLPEFYKDKTKDRIEQTAAFTDTLMALDPRFGYGHTKVYYRSKGKKEAEFIAHAFENRFIENPVFKELAPELYQDMRKMIDDLKPKQE
jgi:SPP1 gp7 family putative phage head morphogenesis protein